jgi:hypothetical protein
MHDTSGDLNLAFGPARMNGCSRPAPLARELR